MRNRKIHIFTDCRAAIIFAFNSSTPRNKIAVILQIKDCTSKLAGSNSEIEVHRVSGHKDKEGNMLADKQAKEAASEMSRVDSKDFPIAMDKREGL